MFVRSLLTHCYRVQSLGLSAGRTLRLAPAARGGDGGPAKAMGGPGAQSHGEGQSRPREVCARVKPRLTLKCLGEFKARQKATAAESTDQAKRRLVPGRESRLATERCFYLLKFKEWIQEVKWV